MSLEENKAIARRFSEELRNSGNMALVDELLDPDFNHFSGAHLSGPEAFKQGLAVWIEAFPERHVKLEESIAEGDRVVNRLTISGTHTGELKLAAGSIPPTGRRMEITFIEILTISKGKIIEHRVAWDAFGMLRQLGAVRIGLEQE